MTTDGDADNMNADDESQLQSGADDGDEGADDESTTTPEGASDTGETPSGSGDSDSSSDKPAGRTYSEDEVRRIQASKDREASMLRQQLEADRAERQQMQAALRELQLSQLPEDQRAAKRAELALKDQEQTISQREVALNEVLKQSFAKDLARDFGRYGLKAEDLSGLETPEAMRAVAFEKKAVYLEKEVKNPRKTPAIAKGKVDSGSGSGGGSGYDPSKFRKTGNIAEALRAKRAAGG